MIRLNSAAFMSNCQYGTALINLKSTLKNKPNAFNVSHFSSDDT